MYCKKIAGLFLFLSFQTYGMLTVNQLPKKRIPSADEIYLRNCRIEDAISKKNYEFNELFFQNKMISDIQPGVMSNLDHKSNIQFIQTSKCLYSKYVTQCMNGERRYNNCLFTLHTFDVGDYTKAMFHYAPTDEENVKSLLRIGGDIKKDRENIMTRVGIDYLDEKAVIGFYKQALSCKNIGLILSNLPLLIRLLEQGLSPNCQDEKGRCFLSFATYNNQTDALNTLLAHPEVDPNIQVGNSLCPLIIAIDCQNIEALNILLAHPKIDPNMQVRNGLYPLICAVGCENVEAIQILLADHRINANMEIYRGITALSYAAEKNKAEALRILLSHDDIDPNAGGIFHSAYSVYNGDDKEIMGILSECTSFFRKYSRYMMYGGILFTAGLMEYRSKKCGS